jgi:hypothetical protein
MRIIKLMPDYNCFPLWEASPPKVGNIDPSDLPISEELRIELLKWAETFDETLNPGDPASSGFKSDESKEQFRTAGMTLAERLRTELGATFNVVTKF